MWIKRRKKNVCESCDNRKRMSSQSKYRIKKNKQTNLFLYVFYWNVHHFGDGMRTKHTIQETEKRARYIQKKTKQNVEELCPLGLNKSIFFRLLFGSSSFDWFCFSIYFFVWYWEHILPRSCFFCVLSCFLLSSFSFYFRLKIYDITLVEHIILFCKINTIGTKNAHILVQIHWKTSTYTCIHVCDNDDKFLSL